MKVTRFWLVVPANGVPRILARQPWASRIKDDEIVIPLTIQRPDGWGKIAWAKEVAVTLPEPPTVST